MAHETHGGEIYLKDSHGVGHYLDPAHPAILPAPQTAILAAAPPAPSTAAAAPDLIIPFLFLIAYFLPYLIASSRRHRNAAAIGLLNLFLGWTALGWIVAIVWSATANTKPA